MVSFFPSKIPKFKPNLTSIFTQQFSPETFYDVSHIAKFFVSQLKKKRQLQEVIFFVNDICYVLSETSQPTISKFRWIRLVAGRWAAQWSESCLVGN